MMAFGPYLAALHLQNLLEQAEVQRRIKLATASQPSVPAWRRSLRAALTSVARTLDPSVEIEVTEAIPAGRGADLLPAC